MRSRISRSLITGVANMAVPAASSASSLPPLLPVGVQPTAGTQHSSSATTIAPIVCQVRSASTASTAAGRGRARAEGEEERNHQATACPDQRAALPQQQILRRLRRLSSQRKRRLPPRPTLPLGRVRRRSRLAAAAATAITAAQPPDEAPHGPAAFLLPLPQKQQKIPQQKQPQPLHRRAPLPLLRQQSSSRPSYWPSPLARSPPLPASTPSLHPSATAPRPPPM